MRTYNNIKIRTLDMDGANKIKPYVYLDYFQDVAFMQTEELHIGFEDLKAKNCCWILMKTKMEILKNPKKYDTLTVSTWPSGITNVEFIRDYEVKDSSGEVVCVGSQQWCLGQIGSHRIVRASEIGLPQDYYEKSVFSDKFNKLSYFDITNCNNKYEYTITYDDYDLNMHTNNVRYGIMVYQALNLDYKEEVKSYIINYHKEVKVNDIVVIYHDRIDKFIKGSGIIKGTTDVSFDFEIELK